MYQYKPDITIPTLLVSVNSTTPISGDQCQKAFTLEAKPRLLQLKKTQSQYTFSATTYEKHQACLTTTDPCGCGLSGCSRLLKLLDNPPQRYSQEW